MRRVPVKSSTRRWRCLPHRMVQGIVRAVKRQPIAPISDRPASSKTLARSMRLWSPPVVCFAPEAALGGLEIQLPLYPRKLTQLRNRGMSEMCQYATSPRRAKSNELLHAPIVPLLLVAPNAFDYTPTARTVCRLRHHVDARARRNGEDEGPRLRRQKSSRTIAVDHRVEE